MGKLLNLNHRPITIITGQSVQRLHKQQALGSVVVAIAAMLLA